MPHNCQPTQAGSLLLIAVNTSKGPGLEVWVLSSSLVSSPQQSHSIINITCCPALLGLPFLEA